MTDKTMKHRLKMISMLGLLSVIYGCSKENKNECSKWNPITREQALNIAQEVVNRKSNTNQYSIYEDEKIDCLRSCNILSEKVPFLEYLYPTKDYQNHFVIEIILRIKWQKYVDKHIINLSSCGKLSQD